MDSMIVVLEPRMKSIDTLRRILKLAAEIEVKDILAVGNKISREEELRFIDKQLREMDLNIAAHIPFDPSVAEADMLGKAPIDQDDDSPALTALVGLKDLIKERYKF
jgi:CO dehydrogenase maturation factor